MLFWGVRNAVLGGQKCCFGGSVFRNTIITDTFRCFFGGSEMLFWGVRNAVLGGQFFQRIARG